MASSTTLAAVDARVALYWSATAYYGINVKGETPADGAAFLTSQYPLANAEQISVGSPGNQLFREEGGIRFVLSIPRGTGVSSWMGQLEALLANFRAKTFSGVRTFAPTSPVLDDSNDQGSYWRLTAVVPYHVNTLG